MSDAKKLALARAIHGTPHATRDSFSPSTWAGVERAWAWVEKHYQPKEPTVKQDTYGGVPIVPSDDPMVRAHGIVAVSSPWTEAQREAALSLRFNDDRERLLCTARNGEWADAMCAAIAKVAHLWQPAPSPAPAGVPTVEECERAFDDVCFQGEVWMDRKAGIAAVRDLFVRTRDERIAELEREFDAYTGKVLAALSEWRGPAWDIDEQIRASVRARNELLDAQRTIATLTKERDELCQEVADRDASFELQWKANMRGIKAWQAAGPGRELIWPDQARMVEFVLNDRDAALARVAELTEDRDKAWAKIDKMHPRLDGLYDFYKLAREVCDGFNTDKPLAEALRLLRSGYDNVCEDAKMLRERVAELEKRGAVDVELPRVETGAVQFDDDWPGVFIRGDNALAAAELVQRAATSIDLQYGYQAAVRVAQLRCLADTLRSCDAGANGTKPTKIDRKHSRDVRRITMEELDRMCTAIRETAMFETRDRIIAGFRAIGFEVEA